MNTITKEEELELIKMYQQVEEDFAAFPEIQTTEDFFRWREKLKRENGEDGDLRTKILEEKISGNKSLELLYAWSKFSRMVDKSKAGLYLTKSENNMEDDPRTIKAAGMLHRELAEKGKLNPERLFGIYRIKDINLGVKYPTGRSFNTPYEYEKALVKEDVQQAWPAVLFVALMNAYGIEANDLITVGRKVESQANQYIAELAVESAAKSQTNQASSPKILLKK